MGISVSCEYMDIFIKINCGSDIIYLKIKIEQFII